MTRGPFLYSDSLLQYDMGPQHPMRPDRLRRTFDLLNAYGALNTVEVLAPELCPLDALNAVHAPEFVEAVSRLSVNRNLPDARQFGFGGGDNPIFPGMFEAARLYTGASLQAAQSVVQGADIAMSISGGLHHAHYDKAAGFCVFNDCAVAIRELRTRFDRVAYIDIDVHHGDGVQELFYGDPTVLTVSIHQSGHTLFPGTGDVREIGAGKGRGFSLNVPVWPGTDDTLWNHQLVRGAMPILSAFKPQAVVLQLGTDAHVLDPLASVFLSAQGWLDSVRLVQSLEVPIVALGGGGYCWTTVPRMWTAAFGVLFDVELPNVTPVSFSDRKEIPTLYDAEPPQVSESQSKQAQAFAKSTLQEIETHVFPFHGLT